eukprot:4783355-Prymnesium_polylepis.1
MRGCDVGSGSGHGPNDAPGDSRQQRQLPATSSGRGHVDLSCREEKKTVRAVLSTGSVAKRLPGPVARDRTSRPTRRG